MRLSQYAIVKTLIVTLTRGEKCINLTGIRFVKSIFHKIEFVQIIVCANHVNQILVINL